MAIRVSQVGLLTLSLVLVQDAALPAQQSAWADCKTDSYSNFNCKTYFSGTVSLASELKTPSGTEKVSITATVTAGKVRCQVKNAQDPAYEGAGYLVVELGGPAKGGTYTVQVWCPGSPGSKVSRDDAPTIDSYEREAADYTVLEGRDAHEHPETDEVNGVTGTETVSWSLKR